MPNNTEDLPRELRIALEDLRIEALREGLATGGFDCGNDDLNRFLLSEEAMSYERERVGRTYLVFLKGELAGYFTVSQGGLRMEYLRTWTSFSRLAAMRLEAIPALTIGRLAVDRRLQGRGIGRILIRCIAGMALEAGQKIAVRVVVLQAKPESIDFYRKCGFELTVETRRERRRVNRTMFLDLAALESST